MGGVNNDFLHWISTSWSPLSRIALGRAAGISGEQAGIHDMPARLRRYPAPHRGRYRMSAQRIFAAFSAKNPAYCAQDRAVPLPYAGITRRRHARDWPPGGVPGRTPWPAQAVPPGADLEPAPAAS